MHFRLVVTDQVTNQTDGDRVQVAVRAAPGITIADLALTIDEGSSDTYTVALDTVPSADVTVTPGVTDDGGQVTISPATLTFTDSNWNIAQNVSLTVGGDSNAVSETVTLSHALAGASQYASVTPPARTFTITEVAPVFDAQQGDLTLGAGLTYGAVNRFTLPQASIAGGTVSSYALTPNIPGMTFDPNARRLEGTPTTVADAVSMTYTATDDDGDAVVQNFEVTVVEPVIISETAVTAFENGATGEYTIQLGVAPSRVTDSDTAVDVTITLSGDNSEVSFAPATPLVFTANNWNTAQTITVTAAPDADITDDTTTISHAVAAGQGNYLGITAAADVVVTADDAAVITPDPVITLDATDATVEADEGAAVSLAATMVTRGEGDTTSTLSYAWVQVVSDSDTNPLASNQPNYIDPAAAGLTGADTATLGFNAPEQTTRTTYYFQLTATATISGQTDGVATAVIALTVTDTAAPTVTLDSNTADNTVDGDFTWRETGAATTFMATATAADPDGDSITYQWRVAKSPEDSATNPAPDLTVSGETTARLSYLPDNIPEVVRVAVYTITVTVTDSVGLSDTATFTFTVQDADGTPTAEAGDDQTVDIGTPVTLDGSASANSGGVADTELDYAWIQTATVTSTAALTAGDDNHVVLTGADTAMPTFAAPDVTTDTTLHFRLVVTDQVTNQTDGDRVQVAVRAAPGITIADLALTIDEGGSDTYTVALDTVPSADVTVTPGVTDDGGQVTISPATLTFTDSNWNTAQTVSLAVGGDSNAVSETVTLNHALAGASQYASVTPPARTFTITEVAPVFDAQQGDLTLGAGLTYGAANRFELPLASIAGGTVSSYALTPNIPGMTFDATARRLEGAPSTVAAAVTMTYTATDDDGDAVVQNFELTVVEPVIISETAVTAIENGATGEYTIQLGVAPSRAVDSDTAFDVTVTLSRDNDEVSFEPATPLVFTANDWNTAQTITVTAAPDADTTDDTTTISHAVAAAQGNYRAITAAADVVVTADDSTVAVVVTPAPAITLAAIAAADEGAAVSLVADVTRGEGDTTSALSYAWVQVVSDSDTNPLASNQPNYIDANTLTSTTTTLGGVDTVTLGFNAPSQTTRTTYYFQLTATAAATGQTDGVATSVIALTVTDTDKPVIRELVSDDNALVLSTGIGNIMWREEVGAEAFEAVVTAEDLQGDTVTYEWGFTKSPAGDTPNSAPDFATFNTSSDGRTLEYLPDNIPAQVRTAVYTITVTVTDSVGNDAAASFTLTVQDADGVPSADAGDDQTVDIGDTVTLDGSDSTNGGGAADTELEYDWIQTATSLSTGALTTNDANYVVLTGATSNTLTFTAPSVTTDTTLYFWLVVADQVTNQNNGDRVQVTVRAAPGITIADLASSIAEGGNDTYSVALTTDPGAGEIVTVTPSSDNTDASVSTAEGDNALTFDTSNWNTAQAITVSVTADDDAVDDIVTLSHAVSGYPGFTGTPQATFRVSDPNTAPTFGSETIANQTYQATVTITDLTLPEASGGNGGPVYTLTPDITTTVPGLSFEATTRVLSGTPTAIAGAAAVELTYTAADADANTGAADEAVLNFEITITPAPVTTPPGITVAPQALTVTEEGASGTYTVVLDTNPGDGASVVVTASRVDDNLAVGTGNVGSQANVSLVFDSTNWNTAQTVNVGASDDANTMGGGDDTGTITHTATGYGSISTADPVIVTIQDNDPDTGPTLAAITDQTFTVNVAITPLTLPDSVGDGTVNFELTPAVGTVLPGLSFNANTRVLSGTPTAVTPTPVTLTYTATDVDGAANAAEQTFMVTIIAASAVAGVTIAPQALTVEQTGNNNSATYTVVLTSDPGVGASATVTPSSDNPDVTLSPTAPLVFTTGNWDTAQTVRVIGSQDAPGAEDYANDTATISHAVANYGAINAADSVIVTVTDPDTRPLGITIADLASSIAEGGSDTYSVALTTDPGAGEIVTVTPSSDNTDASVSTAEGDNALTFDTSNWDTAQVITVSVTADNDAVDDIVTLSHAVSGYPGFTGTPQATFRVPDPNTAPTFGSETIDNQTYQATVTITNLTLPEASGGNGAPVYTLTPDITTTVPGLSFEATTRVLSGTPTAVAGAVALTYTAADADANTGAADEAALNFEITITPAPVVVAPGVTFAPPALTFAEGAAGQYTVVLNTDPGDGVSVTVTPDSSAHDDITAATAETDDALTFSGGAGGTWNTAQTVTVSGAENADIADVIEDITHTVTNYPGVATAAAVNVTVTNNDSLLTITEFNPVETNADADHTYTITRTGVEFTSNVTVQLVRVNDGDANTADAGDADVSGPTPALLTFLAGEDSQQFTMTISGDRIAEGDEVFALEIQTGGRANLHAPVRTVTIIDDDSAGITVNGQPADQTLTVDEGASDVYEVVLTSAPASGPAVITPVSDTPAEVTVSAALTFTGGNWNIAQTVTVSGVENDIIAATSAAISHTVSGYSEFADSAPAVNVSVTNNDSRLTITAGPTTVTETDADVASADYTITRSGAEFGAQTIITLTLGVDTDAATADAGAADITLPATVTFAIGEDEATFQVTVIGDRIAEGNEVFTLATGGGGGNVQHAAARAVTITDNDSAGVTVNGQSADQTLTVDEGASDVYEVVLTSAPASGPAVITPSSDNPLVTATTDQTDDALTFTAGDWNTAQTVTVTSTGDTDFNNDSATISHIASGYAEFTDAAPTVAVTVNDPAPAVAGVTIAPQTLTVDQTGADNSATYTVVLTSDPGVGASATVTPSSDNPDVTLSPTAPLVFTTGNWDTAQTVRVIGSQDAPGAEDYANDTATISHAVANYGAINAADPVIVTVTDPDTRPLGITVADLALTIAEGGSDTYSVALTTDPGAGEIVTVTPSSDNTDASVSTAEGDNALTFDTSNWDTAQVITVSVTADDDAVDDTVTLSHAVSGYPGFTGTPQATFRVSDPNTAPTFGSETIANQTYQATVTITNLTLPEASGGNSAPVYTLTPDIATTVPGLSFDAAMRVLSGTPTAIAAAVELTYTAADADANTGAADEAALNFEITITPAPVTTPPGITVAPQALTVTEEGASGTYTVVLDTNPGDGASVAVTASRVDDNLAVGTGNVGSQANVSLVFDSTNWNTAQTVNVGASDDANTMGGGNDTGTITHTASNYGSISTADPVIVTIQDNDPDTGPTLATINPQTFTVNEVVDLTLPDSVGDGTVNYALTPDVGTVINGLSFNPNTRVLSGTPTAATTTPVTLTYTATDVDGADNAAMQTFMVTITPAVAGITIESQSLTVAEGASADHTVQLSTEPSGNVTVALDFTPTGHDLTATPDMLTFTAAAGNWNMPQTVAIAAAVDVDITDDAATITHTASGATEYDGITATRDVVVTDFGAIEVGFEQASYTVAEGDGQIELCVVVNNPLNQVFDDATFTLTHSTNDVTATGGSGTSNDYQTSINAALAAFTTTGPRRCFNIIVNDDSTPEGDETFTVDLAEMTSATTPTGLPITLTPGTATVTITDNDAGVVIAPTLLTVQEQGAGGIYTVVLTTDPDATVIVTLTLPSGDHDLTITPSSGGSLTFDAGNWNIAQTVSISAGNDDNSQGSGNESATITHTVTGYGSVSTAAPVEIIIEDNDTDTMPALTAVSDQSFVAGTLITPLTLPDSVGDGMVAYTLTPQGDIPDGLDFDDDPMARVLSGTPTTAGTVTLTYTATDADGAANAAMQTFMVTITPAPAVTVMPTTLAINESAAGTYVVSLNVAPDEDVTVTTAITAISPTTVHELALNPATLTFTSGDWNTAQTLTVTDSGDTDAIDDTAAISHTVSTATTGGNYNGVTAASVTVTVTDNTAPDTAPTFGATTQDDVSYIAGATITPLTLPAATGGNGGLTYELTGDPIPTGLSFDDDPMARVLSGTPTAVSAPTTATLTYTVADADSNTDATDTDSLTFEVTITPMPEVMVMPTTLTSLDEDGGTGEYEVVLTTAPDSAATVTPSSSHPITAGVSGALTFTNAAGNWNTPQTVTVTGTYDDNGYAETVTITHMVTGYGAVTGAPDVVVEIEDEDVDDISVDIVGAGPLAVTEGTSTGTYSVVLGTEPTAPVTVSVSSGDTMSVTVSPNTLTFAAGADPGIAQTFTVTSIGDDDAIPNPDVTLTHSVTGTMEYAGVTAANFTVQISEAETAAVTVSAAATGLTLDEGTMMNYEVTLTSAPATNMTAIVTPSSNNAAVTVSAALSFTTGNWNTAQIVTVTAVQNDAATGDVSAVISHTVAGYSGITVAGATTAVDITTADSVDVTVTDLNTVAVTVDPTSLTVEEGHIPTSSGDTNTYTVRLGSAPTGGNVIITPTSSHPNIVSVPSGTALTFTATAVNWNMPQTVTVTGVDNEVDAATATATISHAITGGSSDYNDTDTPAASVTVTVTDDDERGVTVSETTRTIAEGSESGAANTYTVVLDSEPNGNVIITPTSNDTAIADIAAASAALTFDATTWSIEQTVTVTSEDNDIDAANATATISHAITGAATDYTDAATPAAAVTVTVTDDDGRGVTVDSTTLTVTEGTATGTYTVVLDSEPNGNVIITPTSSDPNIVSVPSGTALTFTATAVNWNMPQTVTVTGVDNEVDAANATATISHAITSGSSDYNDTDTPAAAVTVTVTDDDERGVTVSETTRTIAEGSESGAANTYTVVLDSEPNGNVIITPTSSDPNIVSVPSGTALTFTATAVNWNMPQTVTVTGVDNEVDAANATATISHAITSGSSDYNDTDTPAAAVTVTVTDDDERGVTVSETTRTIAEGSESGAANTYTVVLDSEPNGNVIITPSSSDPNIVSVPSGTALTFTATAVNWNMPQTVTVTGVDNEVDAATATATISHAITSGSSDYNDTDTPAAAVTVTVTDDDERGVTVSETTRTIAEGSESGAANTYTVVLDSEPNGNVTITPSSDDTNIADIAAASAALTFTTGDWNTAQTVTVTSEDNDIDADNATATISHAITGSSDYTATPAAAVTVTVTDDDERGVTVSETTRTIAEGSESGAANTYTVVLDSEPNGNVTITPSSDDTNIADIAAASATLTFTTGDWNTAQTVTVTSEDNDIDADNATATISHAITGSSDYTATPAAAVTVTVTDNDTAGITATEATLELDEGTSNENHLVRLDTIPTADVTVTLSSDNTAVVTATPATLTFTASDWNTDKTVTIAAIYDATTDDDTVTVTHTASGATEYTGVSATRQVNVDDIGAIVAGFEETSYTVADDAGQFDVCVAVTSPGQSESLNAGFLLQANSADGTATAGIDYTTINQILGRFNDSQRRDCLSVVVHTAADDGETFTLTLTPDTDGLAGVTIQPATATVTITDDSAPTFGTETQEDQLYVVDVPITDLTLPEASGGNGDLTYMLTPDITTEVPGLTFTATTRVLSGTPATAAAAVMLTYTAADGDSNTATTDTAALTFDITITAAPAVVIDPTALSVDEGTGTATYTVVLNSDPTMNVTVTPSADGVTLSAAALTFTSGDWNDEQTISVTAAEDDNSSDETVTISHTVSGSGYTGVTAANVAVTVTDLDTAGVTITALPSAMTVAEGATVAAYTVVLDTLPSRSVTVTPSSDTPASVSAPARVVFTTSNWNITRTVSVTAPEDDANADNETATISHTVSGYGAVVSADSVTIETDDNDDPGLRITPLTLTIAETGAGNYNVSLNVTPTGGNVTVTLSGSADAVATVAPATLTFTADNWNTAQAVTVTGVDDEDAVADDAVTVTHMVSAAGGSNYESIPATERPDVVVTVTETDVASVTINGVLDDYEVSVDEGSSVTYAVVLTSQPGASATVVVTPSSSDADVTLDPATALTFAGNNWSDAQTVTVTVAVDDDADEETVTISHAVSVLMDVSGSGYDTVTAANVVVTVDEPGISIGGLPDTEAPVEPVVLSGNVAPADVQPADLARAPALPVQPGETADYEVVLDVPPTEDLTVTVSWEGPFDLLIEQAQQPAASGLNTNEALELSVTQTTGEETITVPAQGYGISITAVPEADAEPGPYPVAIRLSGGGNYAGVSNNTHVMQVRIEQRADVAGLDSVNQVILPEVARALAGQQTDAIANRVRQASQSGGGGGGGSAHFNLGGQTSMSTMAARHAKTLADDDLDMKRILGDTDFVIPMGGAVSGLAGGTGASAAFWGAGDYRSLGGESSDGRTKWDGDLFGAHLGFDAHLSPDLLAGLMVSYSEADIDYKHPNSTTGDEEEGDWELEMTGINPYIGWSVLDGQLDMWATLGYGSGDLEITPDDADSLSGDVTMSNFGLGGSGLIRKDGNTGHELRLNAEAFHTRAEIDGADRNTTPRATPELWDLDVDATRLRLMLESRHPRTLATGARLTPAAEIGMRWDSGDGRTGTGAEIGGGIHYQDSTRGLTLEANARALLAHSGDYDDWGISGKIHLQPGADGQGLSLSLTPAYGKTAAATEDIWNKGLLETDTTTTDTNNLQAKLDARVGYGLNMQSALLTPYTEMTWGEESQTYRLGLQWDITKSLDLKLIGEQKPNNNNILLKGEMRF